MKLTVAEQESQVDSFLKNLRQSILDWMKDGQQIVLSEDYDMDQVDYGGFGTKVDNVMRGWTVSILAGRPANNQIMEIQRDKTALLKRLAQ